MNMIIISGLSGSGKSVALHALEDMNYFCIDNLPVGLLSALASEFQDKPLSNGTDIAIGIDARNHPGQLDRFPEIVEELRNQGMNCKIMFLQADDATLLKRFSETRRKHPLSDSNTPLADAIEKERRMLSPITSRADLFIDTSRTNVHQLRDLVMETQGKADSSGFSLLLRSFGYKHGIPADADFVFDARCLPNPHWEPNLRNQTGRDRDVVEFLEREDIVNSYFEHLAQFLSTWIPRFQTDNRSYLTIAIGCTGGQHRSVYLVEQLARHLDGQVGAVVKRHREQE